MCRMQNIRGEYTPLFGECAWGERARGDSADSRVRLTPGFESQAWRFQAP